MEGGGGAAGREGQAPDLFPPTHWSHLKSGAPIFSTYNDFDGPHPRTIGPFVSARPMAPLLGPAISHPELQLFPGFGATSAVTTTNWLSTALGDPFSAIVSGQMVLPLHTAPQAQPRLPAASGKGRESPRSYSRKPSSFSNPTNLARLGQQTVPIAQFWPRCPVAFPQLDLGFMRPGTETPSVSLTAPRAGEV